MTLTKIRHTRYAPLLLIGLVYLLVSLSLRLVLWWAFGRPADVLPGDLPWILGAGLANDLVELVYLWIPLSLYLLFMPVRAFRSRVNLWLLGAGLWLTLFGMVYLAVVEFYFFDEFDARFNLVAVDYLMYSHEVLVNIWDSYPVPQALALTAVAASLLFYLLWPGLRASLLDRTPLRRRTAFSALHAVLIAGVATGCSTQTLALSDNRVENELLSNGLSSFFQAFHTNELDYDRLYRTGDSRTLAQVLVGDLAPLGGRFTAADQGLLTRRVHFDAPGLGKLNLVLVVEESFGCEHVGACGSKKGLTPEFDALARRGLFFANAYATGTRTVRGLEAITASIPPIPSESIVKRPGYEGVANWGEVMAALGYRTSFLYGGFGEFDNMNNFFAAHGYRVSDRSEIDDPRFGNIWGVSDQDLFDHALDYFDAEQATGQPFFALIMSTSNHKPYTFPEGIEGIPATGGGRKTGVRYADYALGELLRKAADHAWFGNTVFVVVADHGARVYGKARIPMYSYHIPLLIYAPQHLQPRIVDVPASQVDIAPTLMALLGLDYEAPFIGRNLLVPTSRPVTLLFNHNHDVALYRNGRMAVLGLKQSADVYRYAMGDREVGEKVQDAELVRLATAYYQTAFELFRAGRYR
jgi:phosphoglycerol transferase MdoB-like AlkP superfamily enzyme